MTLTRQPVEDPRRQVSAPIVVAICGDPIVGRALALLIRSSLYDPRFLSTSSLNEAGALEGIRLVLLTPRWELDAGRREDLLASLGASLGAALGSEAGAAQVPILELTSSLRGARNGEARNGEARLGLEHTVSWPCSTDELERRIEEALLATMAKSNGHARPAASSAGSAGSEGA